MNVKFHMNCENISKVLKISCASCLLEKFDIYLLGLPEEIFFVKGLNQESFQKKG